MATVNLGRIKPVFRGAYSGSTAYVVDDIVTHGNETFICIQAHGAGTQATSQTAYWTKLAAKGADGTDVGTTITTQGDILYRDGSGLQRLAKPASDMYLKNTSGGVLSWAAISSEMVKIGESSTTSSTSGINFDISFDDTTYYKYLIKGWLVYDGERSLRVRLRQAGSTISTSNYDHAISYAYRRYSDGHHGASYGTNANQSEARVSDWDTHTGMGRAGHDFEMHFVNNMQTTDENKYFHGISGQFRSSSGSYLSSSNAFLWNYDGNQAAVTGFHFYPNSGNITSAELKCYGFKK